MISYFLYARGAEVGDIPSLLHTAGFEAYEVEFDQLRDEGGLISFGEPGPAILVGDPRDPDLAAVAQDPNVVAVLTPPIERVTLLAAMRAATILAAERTQTKTLLDVSRALSSERDLPTLERLIIHNARTLTGADAGSLYLIEEVDGQRILRFVVAQTGPTDEGTLFNRELPLTTDSIAGYVAVTGESVAIDDAYLLDETHPFTFNRSFDESNNYRSKSMICVPMRNLRGIVIGAIQLINRKQAFEIVLETPMHTEATVRRFDNHDRSVLEALASQAAIAIENARLVESIQNLFERFVRASVKAIEVRDRSTQGHSERVAALTVAQAEAVNHVHSGALADLFFSADQLREVRYASLLHDFGKVAVPEYIFGKAKKLPDGRLDTVRLRFLLAIEQCIDENSREELRELLTRIEAANEPNVVAEHADDAIGRAMRHEYRDGNELRPLLDDGELAYLRIARGSLSDAERDRMQEHVTQSYMFLREIPWGETPWYNVAEYAYGHHEHLDGTGYPRKLSGDAIAPQVRMMTISDVYDALTATDRPYKKAMSIERSLDILTKEFADRGKIDRLFLDLFIERRLYEAKLI
ncbi:MAG TPA: HD domain-containing phosphohydrolase [Candidatus Dormibacteraeota bacterium]|nr:HD domain-containing phosphohydrolase [Candidatus Dormibacteraeota bacterium]